MTEDIHLSVLCPLCVCVLFDMMRHNRQTVVNNYYSGMMNIPILDAMTAAYACAWAQL